MPGLSDLMRDSLNVTFYHHVHSDGSGYPRLPDGGPPPTLARIVSAADCYDAMSAHRSYRSRPFTGHEVLRILLGQDRKMFDPAVLWALVQTVGLFPAGTVMETQSGAPVTDHVQLDAVFTVKPPLPADAMNDCDPLDSE